MIKTMNYGWLVLAALALASCGHAPPTNFYTLAPDTTVGDTVPSDSAVIPVTMGQVNLPQILDRNNLIIRSSADQITVLQFDRWAAPLDENIGKALTVDLEQRLPPNRLIRSNGSPTDTSIGIIDLYIDRFDSDSDGHVTFDVAWTVTNGNPSKTILRRTEPIAEEASDGSSTAIVQAMSRAVADLSVRIASELPTK